MYKVAFGVDFYQLSVIIVIDEDHERTLWNHLVGVRVGFSITWIVKDKLRSFYIKQPGWE